MCHQYRQKKKKIECTELSKFCSKITDYDYKNPNSFSRRSSKIICFGMGSDSDSHINTHSLNNISDDVIGDSDILKTKTSFSRYPSNYAESEVSDIFKDDKKSYFSDGCGVSENKKSWPYSDGENDSLESSNESPKRSVDNIYLSGFNSQDDVRSEYDINPSPKRSPITNNIHAPKSSSIFSQNHLNSTNADFKEGKQNFFLSRQVSAMNEENMKEMKKSKTLESSYQIKSPKMVIKILKPEERDLDNINLETMIKQRNIMDTSIPSVRSNLNNILKNKKNSRYYQRDVNSEKLDSIIETSVNSKNEKLSSNKKKSSSQKLKSKQASENGTNTSMSHFEFHDHKNYGKNLDKLSKGEISRLHQEGNISESSGLQYIVNQKLSENKDFLSGMGSLNNLTQYIDNPYMHMSKHASRLSRDFQMGDNLSLFKDDVFHYNVEEITKRNSRMSIDNFFSNIKKNNKSDRIADSKLESIQGPYFTGKDSEKNILIRSNKGS